jgi:hypothetical protein
MLEGRWNVDDLRKGLIGLPELRQRLLIVVEPEKAALALRQLGFNATTNPMAAGEWRYDYMRQWAADGATRVVVIPNDEPASRARADAVAGECLAAGLDVRMVLLPAKSVSDWLSEGGTTDDLLVRIDASPFSPTAWVAIGLSGLWLRPFRSIAPPASLADTRPMNTESGCEGAPSTALPGLADTPADGGCLVEGVFNGSDDDIRKFVAKFDPALNYLQALRDAAICDRLSLGRKAFEPEKWRQVVVDITAQLERIAGLMKAAMAELRRPENVKTDVH